MDSEDKAETIRACYSDPYRHVDHLGHGAFGYVDKVVDNGKDDIIDLSSMLVSPQVEKQLRSARNEFTILNRLQHNHIVKVLDIYQYKNRLNIIMEDVADSDLAEYMLNVDGLDSDDPAKDALKRPMLLWPVSLVQAIDYLHEMKIKHKDIKPANILVMDGRVLLADFGISKDLIDQETTASLNSNGDVGTRMYCAPEVLAESRRRGRAADVYSLGCVFVEMATVLLGPKGSLEKWGRHRELSGSRVYSSCGAQTLQWIRYLWGSYASGISGECVKDKGTLPAGLSFLMLDPDSKTRITAWQLVAYIQAKALICYLDLDDMLTMDLTRCCRACHMFVNIQDPTSNIPLHSVYKDIKDLNYPMNPCDALNIEAAPTWEEAKRFWLQSHMWW